MRGRVGFGAALALAVVVADLVGAGSTAEARDHGARRQHVSEIIVHATGGPFCQGGRVAFSPAGDLERMARFFKASGQVSIHYIVGRDGRVAASVPESEVAIHTRGLNDTSIGIELINAGDGSEAYPEAQVASLVALVHAIQKRWRIPVAKVLGHEDVDRSTFQCGGREVRRKQDPGARFPWDEVRRELVALEVGRPSALGR